MFGGRIFGHLQTKAPIYQTYFLGTDCWKNRCRLKSIGNRALTAEISKTAAMDLIGKNLQQQNKDLNKASSSSGPIEYHEALGISAVEYDVMLTDINEVGLQQLGDLSGIQNLSKGSFTSRGFPVEGRIYGPNNRLMVCLNCRIAEREKAPIVKVWFLVETGSNCTFLAAKTMNALLDGADSIRSAMSISIQDPKNPDIECYISHKNFVDANVLGMQAMLQLKISIEGMNRKLATFRLVDVSKVKEDGLGASFYYGSSIFAISAMVFYFFSILR